MVWFASSVLNVTALNLQTLQNVSFFLIFFSEYILWYDLFNCLFFSKNVQLGLPGSCMEPHSHYSYYLKRKPNIFQNLNPNVHKII